MTYRYQFWVSLLSWFSPYWNCSETRFGNASQRRAQVVRHHLLRGVTECCATHCRQEIRNTACKPPYLPVHHLHPADKAALVKYALRNTVFCSEKFKIKILELHHRKGRITPQPPSWNECDSPLLLTCKTAIWNLVGYKMWPTSLFRFISFSQHVTWCKISSSHNTVKRKVLGYLRFLGFGFIWQYVLKHPYWHTQMAQQLLLSKCFWAVSNDFNFLISYSLYKQDCNQVTNRVMKHRVPLKKKSQKYVQKLFKHKFKKTVVSHS